jgi:hypothetical protein
MIDKKASFHNLKAILLMIFDDGDEIEPLKNG